MKWENLMNKKFYLKVVVVACVVSCTPYIGSKNVDNDTDVENSVQSASDAQAAAAARGKVQPTYLDTINADNEVALTQPEGNSLVQPQGAIDSSRFRIQLFASSQIETLREQKRYFESKIELPLYISFETPYYKLLAGDFSRREDAEAGLAKLKKLGYPDAWIVASKPITEN
jgi:cell division septation protein DedD